jgi:hypothetical protein
MLTRIDGNEIEEWKIIEQYWGLDQQAEEHFGMLAFLTNGSGNTAYKDCKGPQFFARTPPKPPMPIPAPSPDSVHNALHGE